MRLDQRLAKLEGRQAPPETITVLVRFVDSDGTSEVGMAVLPGCFKLIRDDDETETDFMERVRQKEREVCGNAA